MRTIERLPLWGDIDEVVGCAHPAVEDEVGVGTEVAAGKEEAAVKVLHVLVRQLVRANELGCQSLQLLHQASYQG